MVSKIIHRKLKPTENTHYSIEFYPENSVQKMRREFHENNNPYLNDLRVFMSFENKIDKYYPTGYQLRVHHDTQQQFTEIGPTKDTVMVMGLPPESIYINEFIRTTKNTTPQMYMAPTGYVDGWINGEFYVVGVEIIKDSIPLLTFLPGHSRGINSYQIETRNFKDEKEETRERNLHKRYLDYKLKHKDDIKDVLEQIGSLTAFLHKNGLRHGNLHGGNILITKNEKPKIYLIDMDNTNFEGEPDKHITQSGKLRNRMFLYGNTTGHSDKHDFVRDIGYVAEILEPEEKEILFESYEREL